MKKIGLLDCNNFFVSCERLFRPDLHKKPVVVLSSNDGCVIARSQEIKDMGIQMGVPYFEIKDTLTKIGATHFSSNFTLYRDISRRVFEVVRQHVSSVEVYSIDECFFAIDSEDAEVMAWRIKRAVEQEIGIPVSIGIASSKTQAKYANKKAKKTNGVFVLETEDWKEEALTLPLATLWGVGRAWTEAFRKKEILTVADLLAYPEATIGSWFGIFGVRLRAELCGRPVLAISAQKEDQKSIMSSRSFKETVTDLVVLEDALSFHLHHVVTDLVEQGLLTRSIRIYLYPSRYSDFAHYGRSESATLALPIQDLPALLTVAKKLLQDAYIPSIPYKKIGVVCLDLSSVANQTSSLFSSQNQTSAVTTVMVSLNKRFGKELLQFGRQHSMSVAWSARQEAVSPCYTTQWNQLQTVRAIQ